MIKGLFIFFTVVSTLTIEAQISDFESISFKNADEIAYSYKGNDLKNLPKLAYNLTHALPTDVEKFRAIYLWVSTNIECDYNSFRKNYLKRIELQKDSLQLNNWNKTFSVSVFKKLLNEKKTVCTGYAYLIKNLSNLVNIDCEIINGYGLTARSVEQKLQFPNHSWNAVKLNNKWYLCDATLSSGAYDLSSNTFEFNYNDGYFLTNPELFAKNHFPIDNAWFLLNEKPILPDFLKGPLLYSNASVYNIFPIEPSVMVFDIEKNTEAVFTLKDGNGIDIKSIYLKIVSGNNVQIVQPKAVRTQSHLIQIRYSFTKQGSYDVHIMINKDIICTYIAKVKKH